MTDQLKLDYLRTIVWPAVLLIMGFAYRKLIGALLPSAKVKLNIGGLGLEATIPDIKESVEESLGGEPLTLEQKTWLKKLNGVCRADIQETDIETLRPLRDSGLIRAYPPGFLQNAEAVEITKLGRLLATQNRLL